MVQISTDLIKELREKTQVGLMDCKKALEQAEGDLQKAIDILRARGAAVAAKRASQQTTQGTIAAYITPDHQKGALVEIACETDFAANTDSMNTFSAQLAEQIAKSGDVKEVPSLLAQKSTHTPSLTLQSVLDELIAKISENIKISRFIRFEGDARSFINAYIHPGSRLGVIVEMRHTGFTSDKHEAVVLLAKEICMQIAVNTPLAVTPQELDPTAVARERAIFTEQLTASGKPAAMLEKIIEGKLHKYYQDVCLLHQIFIKNDKVTIQQHLDQQSKALGTTFSVGRFARFSIAK
jgi:elongation factor Ts